MQVLLVHCDHRPFEVGRFAAAWVAAGGRADELLPVTPESAGSVPGHLPEDTGGVLLTGGPDVEPHRYGRRPQTGLDLDLDLARDALDLSLLEFADAREWPVLAVCYGCQVLAVSRGGTLIQDLPHGGIHAPDGRRREEPAHVIHPTGSRRFLSWLPADIAVNSRHRQAVEEPGRGLMVAARAPDGVIEAVEAAAGDRFVVGVQWHPENMLVEPHLELFRSFRDACLSRVPRPGVQEV